MAEDDRLTNLPLTAYVQDGFVCQPMQAVMERIAAGVADGYKSASVSPFFLLDGAATSGNATTAPLLAAELEKQGVRTLVFETDNYLASRGWRSEQLHALVDGTGGPLLVPPALHATFWRWAQIRDTVCRAADLARKGGGTLTLTQLYSRVTGLCDAEQTIAVKANAVIILAGAYVIGKLGIAAPSAMMLVDGIEGRRRKRQREFTKGAYPSAATLLQVTMTYDLIEHPSYTLYVFQNSHRANVIIDTTEPELPTVIKYTMDKATAARAA